MKPIKNHTRLTFCCRGRHGAFGAGVGTAEESEAEDVSRHATATEWAGGVGRAAEGGPGSGATEAEGNLAFLAFVILWSLVSAFVI